MVPSPSPQFCSSLISQRPYNHCNWKLATQEAMKREEWVWSSPKSHSQWMVTIQPFCKLPGKNPLSGLFFILPNSELSPGKQLYPQAICWTQSVATSQLTEASIFIGNKRQTKTLKAKSGEWDVYRGLWKFLTYALGS